MEEGNDMQQEGGPPGDLAQPPEPRSEDEEHPRADPEPQRNDPGNRFPNDA
jgi:hypothetical protein